MRYEFLMDEIEVPVELADQKIKTLDMVMDFRVGVEVSDEGEVHSPDIQILGKYVRAKGWLAAAIIAATESPYHNERIEALCAAFVPAFDPVREYGTLRAEAL